MLGEIIVQIKGWDYATLKKWGDGDDADLKQLTSVVENELRTTARRCMAGNAWPPRG
jgi:hypothetical protein